MLQTVFAFRGTSYKGNRIPESFEQLQKAARKIMQVHQRIDKDEARGNKGFNFTFITPGQEVEEKIIDDESLMHAINVAF